MTMKNVGLVVVATVLASCGGDGGGNGGGGSAPVNQAPTVSGIADQVAVANTTSAAIAFTVSDEQVGALTVEATSDRQTVVPDAGLSVGGSGANRSVTVTPTQDTVGDALITIVVTDGDGLSASSAFFVTIDPEQRSVQQFARDSFVEGPDDEPLLINAVEFVQDADDDDFADLLMD